jgi:ribonucleotide monophosphatase NagD (HAD superfamily)
MTPQESKTLCIDLDGTLCKSNKDYVNAIPIKGAKEALAKLRDEGWMIVLYTSRHFNHWQTTVNWLAQNRFMYDQIVYGKPPAKFYVDDRAITFEGNWQKICEKLKNKNT